MIKILMLVAGIGLTGCYDPLKDGPNYCHIILDCTDTDYPNTEIVKIFSVKHNRGDKNAEMCESYSRYDKANVSVTVNSLECTKYNKKMFSYRCEQDYLKFKRETETCVLTERF